MSSLHYCSNINKIHVNRKYKIEKSQKASLYIKLTQRRLKGLKRNINTARRLFSMNKRNRQTKMHQKTTIKMDNQCILSTHCLQLCTSQSLSDLLSPTNILWKFKPDVLNKPANRQADKNWTDTKTYLAEQIKSATYSTSSTWVDTQTWNRNAINIYRQLTGSQPFLCPMHPIHQMLECHSPFLRFSYSKYAF